MFASQTLKVIKKLSCPSQWQLDHSVFEVSITADVPEVKQNYIVGDLFTFQLTK